MRFVRNLAIFTVVDVAGMAVGLVTSPITTRLLTTEQYGALPLLAAVWSVATVFQFAGMDGAFIIFQARKDADRRSVIATTTSVATAALVVVWALFSAVSLAGPWLVDYASISTAELLPFLLGLLPTSLVAWHLQLLRFQHEAMRFARVTLVARIMTSLIVLPVMYVLPQEDRLMGALWINAALNWLAFLLALREVWCCAGNPYERSRFSRAMTPPILLLGFSLLPGAVLYGFSAVADRLLLGWYTNNTEVAVFGLAGAVASAGLIIKVAFARTWDPHMVDWIATRDTRIYLPRFQAAADLMAAAIGMISLLTLVWSNTVFHFLFPPAYAASGKIMPVLFFSGALSTLALIAIATETISGRARYRFPIYFAGLFVNISVCLLLIPQYGAIGAAYGALAGEITVLLLWLVVGRWIAQNLSLNWSLPLATIAAMLPAVIAYSPGRLLPQSYAEQAIVTLICCVGAWLLFCRARQVVNHFSSSASNVLSLR